MDNCFGNRNYCLVTMETDNTTWKYNSGKLWLFILLKDVFLLA